MRLLPIALWSVIPRFELPIVFIFLYFINSSMEYLISIWWPSVSKIVQKHPGTRSSHCSYHFKTASNPVCLSEGATVTTGGGGLPIGQLHLQKCSLALAPLFQFSYSVQSVLSAQIYTHCSPSVCCVESVSHVNTDGYNLSERKLNMCQYYMHAFRLKGTAVLIICVINVNQQKMVNKCICNTPWHGSAPSQLVLVPSAGGGRSNKERLFLRSGEWALHTALTGIQKLIWSKERRIDD